LGYQVGRQIKIVRFEPKYAIIVIHRHQLSPAYQVKYHGQYNTKNNAAGQRKIKRKVSLFDIQVTGNPKTRTAQAGQQIKGAADKKHKYTAIYQHSG